MSHLRVLSVLSAVLLAALIFVPMPAAAQHSAESIKRGGADGLARWMNRTEAAIPELQQELAVVEKRLAACEERTKAVPPTVPAKPVDVERELHAHVLYSICLIPQTDRVAIERNAMEYVWDDKVPHAGPALLSYYTPEDGAMGSSPSVVEVIHMPKVVERVSVMQFVNNDQGVRGIRGPEDSPPIGWLLRGGGGEEQIYLLHDVVYPRMCGEGGGK